MSSSQQERLDAKNAVDEAQRKVDVAEAAFTEWKSANGILPNDVTYTELKEEVLRCDANLARKDKLYNDLVNQSQQPQGKFVCRRD